MPTVWVRGDPKRRTRFHRSPECRQLRKGPAKGEHYELIAIDLAELDVRPCRTCYPDAPKIKIYKRFCHTCNSNYACPHNGGVPVTVRDGRQCWVWPDTNQMPYYRKTA